MGWPPSATEIHARCLVLSEQWMDSLPEGWWDDAADAGGILDSLSEAFEAGFIAAMAEYMEA